MASVVDYKTVARPNCSLTPRGRVRAVLFLAALPLAVALGFALAGAWLVFPFAGLELLALAYAFYLVNRHAGDYESITIDQNQVVVEQCCGGSVIQTVFQRYWVHVVSSRALGGEQRLWLRSHGKQVEVGRYISGEQRQNLASQLRKRVGITY